MKKILITGASGYIGSMLCTELVKENYNVIALDKINYSRTSLNHLFYYKNFQFHKVDVTNDKVIKKFLKKVDYIIPLAALVGAPLCEKNKKLATNVNLNAIKKILQFKKAEQKIIYLNSNSGYGIGEKNKYCDETSPLNPISHYGITKVQAENEVFKQKNKNFVCFRLATVFGFSYRMRTDLIVNFFIKEALTKGILSIFEPHFRRNFIHVRDVVNAILFTIKNFGRVKGQVYNLGLSNANVTKLDLAKLVKKELPKTKIKQIFGKKDPDQRDYFVSNKKIEKKGFKATINLKSGINEVTNCLKLFNNYENNY